jgi:hypothetical protein
MDEQEWLACDNSFSLMDSLRETGSDRKHLLAAIHACRSASTTFQLPVLSTALTICERKAEGRASDGELHRLVNVLVNRLNVLNPDPTDPKNQSKRFAAGNVVGLVDALVGAGPEAGTSGRIRGSVQLVCVGERDAEHVDIIHDIFGNPFRPVAFDPAWRTSDAVALAQSMYDARNFGAMPILADALQDAGCDSADVLTHCRDANQVHVRGCWVCDLVLGKE